MSGQISIEPIHIMTADELHDIATLWIVAEGDHCQAWEKLCDLVLNEPENAWVVIEEIAAQNISDKTVGGLAAGPLEDLLVLHGKSFIDRIESKAKSNSKFSHILAGVWRSNIDLEVWKRIENVRGRVW